MMILHAQISQIREVTDPQKLLMALHVHISQTLKKTDLQKQNARFLISFPCIYMKEKIVFIILVGIKVG